MGKYLPEITLLKIEMGALRHCMDRPDYDDSIVPGEQMHDDDYRRAIRQEFDECPEFEEYMVDILLQEVKDDKALRASISVGFNPAGLWEQMLHGL